MILAFLKSNSKYICTFSYFCLAPLYTTYELPAVAAGKTENHGVAENRIFAGILSHSYCSECTIYCAARANADSFHHNKRDLLLCAAVLIDRTKTHKKNSWILRASTHANFNLLFPFWFSQHFPRIIWHFGNSSIKQLKLQWWKFPWIIYLTAFDLLNKNVMRTTKNKL